MSGLNILVKTIFITYWEARCLQVVLQTVVKIKWCLFLIMFADGIIKLAEKCIAVGFNYTKGRDLLVSSYKKVGYLDMKNMQVLTTNGKLGKILL